MKFQFYGLNFFYDSAKLLSDALCCFVKKLHKHKGELVDYSDTFIKQSTVMAQEENIGKHRPD